MGSLINFILFYIYYLVTLIVFSSYGQLINKYKIYYNNIYFNFLLSLPLSLILGFTVYVAQINFYYFNIIFFIIGITIFFKKKDGIKFSLQNLIIVTILFPGLLILKSHDDFILYHFQYLKEITSGDFFLGIGHLEIRYIYSSLLNFSIALSVFPYFDQNFFNTIPFLIFVTILGFLISEFKFKKNINFIDIIKYIIFFFVLIKLKRLSEFGFDYYGQLILIFIFILMIEHYKSKNKFYFIYILLFWLLTITIKINNLFSIFFIMTYVFFFRKHLLEIFFKINIFHFLIFALIIINLINSIITSGCLVYFLPFTCFSSLPWAINPENIIEFREVTELWAKGFYHTKNNYLSKTEFLNSFFWIKNWFINHSLKEIEFFLTFIFISILILFVFNKKIQIKQNDYKLFYFYLLIGSLLSSIFWFSHLPQLRFGFSYIIIFIILIYLQFIKIDLLKRNITILIFIPLIFYSITNIKRINHDFFQKEKNLRFPFFILENNIESKKFSKFGILYSPENKEKFCFNITSPCTTNEKVTIGKFYNVKYFYEKN